MVVMFRRLDRDRNGQLSAREFTLGMQHAHAQGRPGKPHPKSRRGPPTDRLQAKGRHRQGAALQGAAILGRLRAADRNQDGRLTKDEAPSILRKHFDALDRNGDGALTPPELRSAVRRIQKQLAAHRLSDRAAGPHAGKKAHAHKKSKPKAGKKARAHQKSKRKAGKKKHSRKSEKDEEDENLDA